MTGQDSGHSTTLIKLLGLCAAVAATAARPAHADNVELRIATLAPSGSPWMEVLDKAANETKDKTAGRVTLKYFAGGQQGDERDFVRKMRLGQLSGAAVTSIGLGLIQPEVRVLEVPLLINGYDELDYVRGKLADELRARFDEKAARFYAKADATGKTAFHDRADDMRERGAALEDKFLTRTEGTNASTTTHAAAQNAQEQAEEAARENAREHAKHAAKEAAHDAARDVSHSHGEH